MATLGYGAWDLHFPPGPPDLIAEMVATAVVADAVRRYDADLAQSVETCREWRRAYRRVFRGMTALAASSPDASRGIARDGLRAVRATLNYTAGQSVRPLSAVDPAELGTDQPWVETGEVAGEAKPERRLEVRVGGERLSGDRLRRQLRDWRRRGILEPDFATRIERVIDHPEWLALPGFRAVLAGADAELSPLRPLLRWGADVLAFDLPSRRRWRDRAREGAGRLRFPVLSGRPGADLAAHLPAVVRWIDGELGDGIRPVLGLYAAAAGPAGLRLAAAADLLADAVSRRHPNTALAYPGSPFDCYAVPRDVFADARERRARLGMLGTAQDCVRVLSGGSAFRPNYRHEIADAAGARWGVADLLPPPLGPNHALAHRLPRWRGRGGHPRGQTG
ncbi:hypothetical protein [Nocardia wallacei]|uniref:hypothetical protein n=1 Tax=Nocardia wallacei TaxID=480035 RepID=UPI0024578988|nr:hypothetical protein [Nocardia wallacei]